MAKYVLPAIFTKEEDGKYSIVFPDLDGCYTSGDDLADGIYMAEDVLAFTLFHLEKEHLPIPELSENFDVDESSFVNYIVCDTIEYQKMNNNKAVKNRRTVYLCGNVKCVTKKLRIIVNDVISLSMQVSKSGLAALQLRKETYKSTGGPEWFSRILEVDVGVM